MSKKFTIISTYCLLFLAWVIFSNLSSNPPNGRTNAPFDSFCTGCHGGSSSLDGTVSLSGIPSTVEAGISYSATVTVENTVGNAVRAGFQMVSVFDSNKSNAGDFQPNSGDEGTQSSGGREYVEHRGAKNFSSNTASWTFDWVAPAGPDGASIKMYYAGNITNGSGTSSGDKPKSGNSTFTLSAPGADPLQASISSKTNVDCNGENTGSATVAGTDGTLPYSYVWSNGGTSATINNLAAGGYTATVTDNDGETATASTTITEPSALTASSSSSDVACRGENTGSASVNANGGNGSYSYNWSNGMNTATINNIPAGTYDVTVTDANGCTTTESTTVTEPASALIITATSTDEMSNMAEDGTASVDASGGTGTYTYSWSMGGTTKDIMGLVPGSYEITVMDANGCTEVAMVAVQAFACSMTADVAGTNVGCTGEATGSAEVTVTNATLPVTYSWSNGDNTAISNNLAAGMYDVTVQDADSCQVILLITITEPDAISGTLVAVNLICPDDSTGSLMVIASGGTMPYAYLWSTGTTTTLDTNLPVGSYSVIVTDANGCMMVYDTSLIAVDSIPPIAIANAQTLYIDAEGLVTITPAMVDGGSTDNCMIDSMWLDQDTFTCAQVDTLLVTLTVIDQAGNIDDSITSVIVLDTMLPFFTTCVEDITVDSGTIVEYTMPIAEDNCGIDSMEMIEGMPSGSVFPVGETKVSYMATDPSGNINCCSFFVTVEGMITDVVDQAFSQSIKVFPNPVITNLNITLSDLEKTPLSVNIYDVTGKLLQELSRLNLNTDVLEIDVSDWSSGIYLVRLEQAGKLAFKKVIKR